MIFDVPSSIPRSIRQVASILSNLPEAQRLFSNIESSTSAISCRVPILGSAVAIRIVSDASGGFLIGAYGLSQEATQWLNEVIVIQASVVVTDDGKTLQVLYTSSGYNDLVLKACKAADMLLSLRSQDEGDDFADERTVPIYWASETFNFGDWIGPQLVHAYTGRQPIHIRRLRKNRRALFTVGSILGVVRRNNVDIWGTGLIKPLTPVEIEAKKKLTGIKVHAVRGKLTQQYIQEQVGWDVPDVYGDPALLLPEIVPSNLTKLNDVTCVPHYVHRDEVLLGGPDCDVVDVRNEVATVARQIASAEVVVSSSLHGLILAQAYGVPWVRLDVTDRPLTGGDFKFNDFYSCLDEGEVSTVRVKREELPHLNFGAISRQASLPQLNIDLALLRDSLPTKVASKPVSLLGSRR